MRFAFAAVVLLAALGLTSADSSHGHGLTGVLTCVLPVTRLVCIRDWRSGFVAGVKFGYDGVSDTTKATTGNFMQVCSTGIYNQTSYDLSVNSTINTANNNAPAWYKQPTIDSMVYPANAAITQVIVLHAANPWGSKFGNIPAILFGYQTDEGINFAVCGNPVYAAAYLNPARAAAAPTPVTLKAVYNSPLSEDDELTVLGGFEGKCSTRGTSFSAFLGGDPHKSSKFFIKALKKVCFTKASNAIQGLLNGTPARPVITNSTFSCDNHDHDDHDHEHDHEHDDCLQPCHYDKKHSKKSTSYSCAMNGHGIATGKYGAIMFDKYGEAYDWERDEEGKVYKVKAAGDITSMPEGDFPIQGYNEEPEDEERP